WAGSRRTKGGSEWAERRRTGHHQRNRQCQAGFKSQSAAGRYDSVRLESAPVADSHEDGTGGRRERESGWTSGKPGAGRSAGSRWSTEPTKTRRRSLAWKTNYEISSLLHR